MIYTIKQIQRLTKNVFEQNSFVQRVYIFGSYARNEAKETSDIDFMIVVRGEPLLEFYGLYQELEDATGKQVDVLSEKEALRIMPNSIRRDMVLIYERQN